MNNVLKIIVAILIALFSLTGLFYYIGTLFYQPEESHIYLLHNKIGDSECGDLNTDYYYLRTGRGIDGRDIAYTDKAEYFCYSQFKEIKNWESR